MAIADHAAKGGQARAWKLTAEMRRASARKAANARWGKPREDVPPAKPHQDRTSPPDTEFDQDIDPHMGRE